MNLPTPPITGELIASVRTIAAWLNIPEGEVPVLGAFLAIHGTDTLLGFALTEDIQVATNGDVLMRGVRIPAGELADALASYEAGKTNVPTTTDPLR